MLTTYLESIYEHFCCMLSFNEASRLIWLSIFWFFSEFITRIIANYNQINHFQMAKSGDKRSWILIILSSLFMLGIVLYILHLRLLPDLPTFLIPIGIVLMVMGIALRMWAVITLGKFFTVQVRIFSNHHLIDIGPYRWLQHPSYSGIFLTAAGLGLATGYLVIMLSFLMILGFVLGYRIYVEEKALKEKFCLEWQVYSSKTWRILPWIF